MAAQSILLPPETSAPDVTAALDLSSVRLLRVPEAAPPFDPEVFPVFGPPRPEFPAWVSRAQDPALDPDLAPPLALEDRDPAGDWTQQFARLLTETLADVRPPQQLLPWMTDRAKVHLHRAATALRCGQRPRVLRVLPSWPSDATAELTIVVRLGSRIRALAVRLEKTSPKPGQPPRWLCTDIETA